jgi:threonyl-tRNA synthetase
MAAIKLPDGSVRQVEDGSSVLAVAESIGKRLAQAAVVAKLDGKLVDLATKIAPGEHSLQIITDRDPEGLLILRHSTAHVMAEAIQRIWPQAQLAYGPPLETGFYYDIALDRRSRAMILLESKRR